MFICTAPFVLADGIVWAAVPIFAAVGLLFPAAVTLLTFEANRLLGPVITGALGNLAPLFAVLLAIAAFGEPLRAIQFATLIMIVAGTALLTITRPAEFLRGQVWYFLLPLAAAAIRGFIQPTIKAGLALWPSPFAAALIGYLISALLVIAAAWLRKDQLPKPPRTLGIAWFIGVGLCNGLAVLLMYAALANGPVTLVSPLVATYPLVTVILSALCLSKVETGVRTFVGVALTVAGVVLLIVG